MPNAAPDDPGPQPYRVRAATGPVLPYSGTSDRTQAPVGAFQTGPSYNFQRQLRAAFFDATYHVGGQTMGIHRE